MTHGKTSLLSFFVVVCSAILVFIPALSQADSNKPVSADEEVSNRLIIKYKPGTSRIKANAVQSSLNLKQLKSFRVLNDINVVEVAPGSNTKEVLASLWRNPDIAYVEFDQPIYIRQVPDDPRFTEQWSLNNESDVDMNAVEAWDIHTGGSNVVLAVIDTGVDYTHEDLRESMWRNPGEIPNNGIDDDGNGYIDDIHGIDPGDGDVDPMDPIFHGTHLAGIIAAKGNNAIGITGVSWHSKVLACKIFSFFDSSMLGFASFAVECLDYILDLKLNHGINIVASNNSWGWTGAESKALKEAIQRNADAGILFVAAAGNDFASNDSLEDFPSTYYLPNIISVAAGAQFNALAFFSNYGEKTVHVTAPGENILSTIPGREVADVLLENPYKDIFEDNVESGAVNWSAESPWEISNARSHDGVSSWTDSANGNYADNTHASLTSPALNLSGHVSQRLRLGFFADVSLENGFDNVYVELSGDGGASWILAGQLTGEDMGWKFYQYLIPDVIKTADFKFRFRLISDDFINLDGVYIDDIGVGIDTAIASDDSNRYEFFDGTSMAAPHVVGLIGLIKSHNPTLTMSQIKNLVIAGGKPVDELLSKTVSGRRIRAADSDGTGSLTCNEQKVLRRLRPAQDVINVGNSVEEGILQLAFLNINCADPDLTQTINGDLIATIVETGDTIALRDNGDGFDQLTGDGVFSAQYNAVDLNRSSFSILLPDGETIFVRKVELYTFTESIAYQWREIATNGNELRMHDDLGVTFNSPFPIPFGNDSTGYEQLHVSDNGIISLYGKFESVQSHSVTFFNEELPTTIAERVVSPYWFDLFPRDHTVYWGVLGQAPNRELVVQWDDISLFGSPLQNYLTFQVVFFENKSGIVFSYQDVKTGVSILDNGGLATVGVQMHSGVGKNFSFRTAKLDNSKSILWTMPGESIEGYNNQSRGFGGGGSLNWLFLGCLLLSYALFLRARLMQH